MQSVTKRVVIILAITLSVTGCVSAGPFAVGSVTKNLKRLQLGMSKSEVLKIVGEPQQTMAFQNESGQPVEILLYQTQFVGVAVQPTCEHLTPVVIVEGQVTAWGGSSCDTVRRYKVEIESRTQSY